MKVHIIGAGPTGLSVAWELSKIKGLEIKVLDKKPGPGGSWWEPVDEHRDVHAARAVFRRAFVNTDHMFKEMGLKWEDYFEPFKSGASLGLTFSAMDYVALGYLALRVLMSPHTYKKISVKDALSGELSKDGQKCLENLTYQLDGVSWDTMTAYEFIRTIDYTSLSKIETQKVPGHVLNHAMQVALEKKGVEFLFEAELSRIIFDDDGEHFKAYINDSGEPIEEGLLVLCLDAGPASKIVGTNWGPDTSAQLLKNSYSSVSIMYYFKDKVPPLPSGLFISMNTKSGMLAHALDEKTVVIELLRPQTQEPDKLSEEMLEELKKVPGVKLPELLDSKIGWGSGWIGEKWVPNQTSSVIGVTGPIPFFGRNKNVALVGMMSDRGTPFACFEAAVEVGRLFVSQKFNKSGPRTPWTVSKLLLVIIILWLAYSLKK